MPNLEITVYPPKGVDGDWKNLKVAWPFLPLKGHKLNLGHEGATGTVDVRVVDVIHWIGCNDINIYCVIDASEEVKVKHFHLLSKEDGWEW